MEMQFQEKSPHGELVLYLCYELFRMQDLSTEVSVLINRNFVCSRIVVNSVFSFGLNAATTVALTILTVVKN